MLKAMLIGNPASGAGRFLASVELPGKWVRDPKDLDPDACLDADLIALFGGDGTVQKTISRLLDTIPAWQLPPIAVLPFGTTNMSAGNLNQTGSRASAVQRLLWMIEHEQLTLRSRRMLRVQYGNHVEHGFFFGLGAIAEAVETWHQNRKPGTRTNQLRSVQALVDGLHSARSTTGITLDGASCDVYGLLATTLDRLLLRSRPYWGDAEDGSLRLTWIDAGTPQLLMHVPALLRGSPRMAGREGFHSTSPSCAQLTFSGPFILDGEIHHLAQETMTIAPSDPLRWVML